MNYEKNMDHRPDMEFEAYYAAIRSPLKDIRPEGTKRVADAIANGDVAWLERALENPQLQRSGKEGKVAGNMIYALAHWLVDGSGREDIARKWMEVCGHTKDRAADAFAEQFEKNDLSEPLIQQRCLGLSTLVDTFSQQESSTKMAGLEHMLDMKDDRTVQAHTNMLLAAILRMSHPEAPPTYRAEDGKTTPLIELLWTVDIVDRLLPAIGHAYGRGNPEVEAQMVAGIHKHIDANMLAVTAGDLNHTWDLIKEWHGPGIGPKIWEANTRSHQFAAMCVLNWGPEAVRHLEQVLDDGADINALVREPKQQSGPNIRVTARMTALDVAISLGEIEPVVWFLERGADHTVVSQCEVEEQCMNALDRAKYTYANGLPFDDNAQQIISIVEAAIAKRSALDAIAEIDGLISNPRP